MARSVKRFTETNKWNDPWYRKMSPTAKLLWSYMTDFCNCVGEIHLDLEAASFHIGEKIKNEHVEELEGRVLLVGDGRYYIPQFIPFQYGELSIDCRAHQPVFKLIASLGLVKNGTGYDHPKERIHANFGFPDTEQAKAPEKPAKSAAVEIPKELATPEFLEWWEKWLEYLRAKRKSPSVHTQELQLKFLQEMGSRAVASVKNSIRNNWQGLFDPNQGAEHQKPHRPGEGQLPGGAEYEKRFNIIGDK